MPATSKPQHAPRLPLRLARLVHLVRDPRPAPLPAAGADLVAFLAAEHGRGISVNTWTSGVRRSAISHFIAGLPVPTAEARVT